MEIRELAECILFGRSWAEKLRRAESVADTSPGPPIAVPEAPGRPPGLEFRHARSAGSSFPGLHRLESPGQRGQVLHSFANHELLALELMALALLRFPDAPAAWRRSLVAVMAEEQSHLELYLDRMTACGVEPGEMPVTSFFWDHLANSPSPLDFVTHMSLTFEQANLDFSLAFEQAFRAAGDVETAAVLARVYREEIGHVKHGLSWFHRLRAEDEGAPVDESEWDAYRRLLRAPFTPSRARGIGFDREGREQAGFTRELIDRLEVFALAKGRAPTVRLFNPACEEEVARGKPGFSPPLPVAELARDLETLPMFLSAAEDAVLVREPPRTEFLAHLQHAGFQLPRFVTYDGTRDGVARCELASHRVGGLEPWGASPDSQHLLAPLGDLAVPAAWIYSKATGARLLAAVLAELPEHRDWLVPANAAGVACDGEPGVDAAIAGLRASGHGEVLVKAAFSSAGRKRVRLAAGAELSEGERNWLASTLAQDGSVVVEPRHQVVCDLSLQLELDGSGGHRVAGLTRFFTAADGSYRGTLAGNAFRGLEPELHRFLHQGERRPGRLNRVIDTVARHVARAAHEAGHRGAAGVDMLVARDRDGALRLRPLVELNPRTTMGRVALGLARHVSSSASALFVILHRSDLRKHGADSLAELAAALAREFPLELSARDHSPRIHRGFLALTDPQSARAALACLIVTDRLQCNRFRIS